MADRPTTTANEFIQNFIDFFSSKADRVTGLTENEPALKDRFLVGVVAHGKDEKTERPAGFGSIIWIGSVEPLNAVDNDIWLTTNG